MAATDIVNRVFREFNRYTGDGLPGEPSNSPLPVGDPQSGVYNPKKSEIRAALIAAFTAAGASTEAAEAAADRAEAAAEAAASVSDAFARVPSIAAMKALNVSLIKQVFLNLPGRAGLFVWIEGNFTDLVASDTQNGVFAKSDAVAASSGAWQRAFSGGLDLRWFGAQLDNTTDDTVAFACMLTVALTYPKAPRIDLPPGLTKVNSDSLPDITKSITIKGAGRRNSMVMLSGTKGIAVRATAARIADAKFEDWSINGFSMTGGDALTLDFTQSFVSTDFSIYDPFNGVSIRQSGKLTFNDVCIEGAIRGTYGMRAFGSNTARNGQNDQIDIIEFNNSLIQSNYVSGGAVPSAEGFVADGRVHSIQINGLRCLSLLRGFVTKNTPGLSSIFVPRFIKGSGLEVENTYAEPLLMNWGSDILLSEAYAHGSATSASAIIGADCGIVKFEGSFFGESFHEGLINRGAALLMLDNCYLYQNSKIGTALKSGVLIQGSGTTVVDGGSSGKASWLPAYTENQKYGIELASSFNGVLAVDNMRLVGNATGPMFEDGGPQVGSHVRGCLGYNPGGSTLLTAPGSGAAVSPILRDRSLNIYGGAGVVVTLDGVAVANSTPCQVFLPARKALTLSYTTVPTIAQTLF